jgi:hypothetical protein
MEIAFLGISALIMELKRMLGVLVLLEGFWVLYKVWVK